jgi:hypothetical protein
MLLDDERDEGGWKNGAMIAKMDANGEFVWKKVVRSNNIQAGWGHVYPQWAEFKEDAIYISFNFDNKVSNRTADRFHFLGEEKNKAEIEASNAPPFKQGYWTAFVKLSYDGEVLEKHFIQIGQNRNPTGRSFLINKFHIDNSGNTYIFALINAQGSAELPFPLYLDDINQETFYIPRGDQGNELIIIKLNSDWQMEWIKPMYYDITDTANSNAAVNNPNRLSFTGLSSDEDDNMYLTGIIDLSPNYNVPMYVYFDPEHRLVMNDQSYLSPTGYIVKYDVNGNVKWCNQLYSNSELKIQKNFTGNATYGNAVYVLGVVYENNAFYNGIEYVEITSSIPSQIGKAFIVKFNKETGLYLNHDIIPNEIYSRISMSARSKPSVINNRVVLMASLGYEKEFAIASFRTDNCQFVEVLDTIYFINGFSTTGSVLGNSRGDMFIDFIADANTITLGNLSPIHTTNDNAVFAYKRGNGQQQGIENPVAGNISISVYPNPVKDELFILNSGQFPVTGVEILDSAGKTITGIKSKNINSVDVSALPQGIYLIKIYAENGATVEKFSKKASQ